MNEEHKALWTGGIVLSSTLPTCRVKTELEKMSETEKKALEATWVIFGK